MKNEDEIINPVVILSSDFLPPSANYAYIEKFSRYYYISGQRVLPGKQLEIMMRVDVLMSFKSAINNAIVVARRSTNQYNKLLPDTIPLQANRNLLYRKFTGGNAGFGSQNVSENSKCYCLTVLNGGTQLNPPSSLVLATEGFNIAAAWDSVTGAFDYDVVYRLQDSSDWTHYVNSAVTITRHALITVDVAGVYDVGVAPKDATGGIIGAYTYGTISVSGG